MKDDITGLPLLTEEQARFVKHLRLERGCTWRRLAREFTRKYETYDHGYGTDDYQDPYLREVYKIAYSGQTPGPNECSSQLLGQDLHQLAARILGEDPEEWDA